MDPLTVGIAGVAVAVVASIIAAWQLRYQARAGRPNIQLICQPSVFAARVDNGSSGEGRLQHPLLSIKAINSGTVPVTIEEIKIRRRWRRDEGLTLNSEAILNFDGKNKKGGDLPQRILAGSTWEGFVAYESLRSTLDERYGVRDTWRLAVIGVTPDKRQFSGTVRLSDSAFDAITPPGFMSTMKIRAIHAEFRRRSAEERQKNPPPRMRWEPLSRKGKRRRKG